MKNVIITCLALSAMLGNAMAQAPASSEALVKEKMQPLMSWVGHWKGEGTTYTRSGEARKSNVDERIEAKLGGVALFVEGIGKVTDPATKKETVVHQAMGVVSFDDITNQYKLKSWVKEGKSVDGWFTVTGENNYQWGFDTPGGKIRYTIVLNPAAKTWYETGEFSRDGTAWNKFFEMTLARQD